MIIYKTTNTINGKIYIGQDSKNNDNYLGSGLLLMQAIEKYGKENFHKEIIEYCKSKEELNEKEKYWIKTLNANTRGVGYNIAEGGSGGDVFTNHPNKEEYRRKISESAKKSNRNPLVLEKLRNASKNNWAQCEYRKKVISRMKEKFATAEYKENLSNAMKKVEHTEEWNKKVGNNNLVRYHFKKIEYFISKNVSKECIAKYFNVPVEKLTASKNFSKEPTVEVLIECKKMYDAGISIGAIMKKMTNSPTRKQIYIFIDMCNVLERAKLTSNY